MVTAMILKSQICWNTPTVCIAAIFVKYCYTAGSWLLELMSWYVLFRLLIARGNRCETWLLGLNRQICRHLSAERRTFGLAGTYFSHNYRWLSLGAGHVKLPELNIIHMILPVGGCHRSTKMLTTDRLNTCHWHVYSCLYTPTRQRIVASGGRYEQDICGHRRGLHVGSQHFTLTTIIIILHSCLCHSEFRITSLLSRWSFTNSATPVNANILDYATVYV